MAVSENDTSDCNSDSSADGMSKERREKPFTKAIIRRLPPLMSQETFFEQVSPLPDYDYMYFVKADLSLGEYAFSRAYINFKNSSDIFLFKEKFDNYVFLDQKGNEYPAVVEFAPFSRIPKKRNKIRVDPKCALVETDPIYLEFLESLKNEDNENEEKPEYCFQPTLDEEKQKIINTPLLDFIKQRRIDRQKIREEKREERKRKELERKRFKEEERRRKTRTDTYQSKSTTKNVQILNSTKDSTQTEERREEKVKERKYEDTKYERKPYKDDRKYPSYSKSKEIRKSDDFYKKSPSKIRPRFEKPDIKPKLDPRRKDETFRSSRRINEYSKEAEEERVVEKKVKKYSERREERKNEIKKFETFKSEEKNKENQPETKIVSKETKPAEVKETQKQESVEEKGKEQFECKENDPRSQRRIRNKDRPSLQIYQPGMGFRRNKSEADSPVSSSETKSESQTSAT